METLQLPISNIKDPNPSFAVLYFSFRMVRIFVPTGFQLDIRISARKKDRERIRDVFRARCRRNLLTISLTRLLQQLGRTERQRVLPK